jgi:hypothetical protein
MNISFSLVDAFLPLREDCCFHLQNKAHTDGKFVDGKGIVVHVLNYLSTML